MAGITKAEKARRAAEAAKAGAAAAPAPAAVGAPVQTSGGKGGIPDLTAGETTAAPVPSIKTDDYDWGNDEPEVKAADSKADAEGGDAPAGKPAPAGAKDGDGEGGDDDEAPAPPIGDDLIKRAADLGLPAAVAKAFETPEALTKYLDSKVALVKPADGDEKNANKGVDNESHFEFNADAFKDYPPEVQATLGGMAKLMKQQGEQLSTLRSELTKRASSVELDVMDKAIDAIGDDKVFGKGATSALGEGEPAANRAKLIQAAQVLIAGREALGQPPLSMGEAFQKAYKLEFEDRVEARANAGLAQKVQKRVSQVLGRSESIPGTVAQQASMTPEQRAIQKGRALLAQRGHTVGAQANSMVSTEDSIWG